MLVGRAVETERLGRLLADARAGRAGALLLRGEAGMGKTQLMAWTEARAHGMHIARAAGTEADREIAFAGLLGLILPITSWLGKIPERQAFALRGALGLGPPVADARFLIAGATLSLFAAVAEREPLLVLIDDVQWMDEPSTHALLFAARRLVADRVAVVFAVRDDEMQTEFLGVEELRLTGLNPVEAGCLLSAYDDRVRSPEVEAELHSVSGGNPLALQELAGALDADQLAGHRAIPELISVGARLEGVYASRVGRLPSATQKALLVLAVSGEHATHLHHALSTTGGLDLAALLPAEQAGLVEMHGGIVRFCHPTMRSAIYHAARAVDRRRAHAAVAATFPDGSAQRAGHLAGAATGVDENVATQLEAIAWRAVGRSGFATASSAFERAARLSVADDTRARRLIEAAQAAVRAGDSRRAHALVDSAEPSPENASLRGEVLALQGHLAHLGGDAAAVELLARAAALVAGDDPGRAVTILANAVESCVFTGRDDDLQLVAQRIVDLAQPDDPRQQFFAHLTSSTACFAAGRHDEGVGHAEQAMNLVTAGLPAFEDPHHLAWTAIAPASLGRFEVATSAVRDVIVQLRELGAVGALPFALRFSARVALQTGRWRDAYIAVSEALDLARETGQRGQVCDCLAVVATIEAVLGREAACRTHATEAIQIATTLGLRSFRAHGENALGLLELGAGRSGKAAEHLERALAVAGRAQVGAFHIAAADLVEALVRLGDTDRARAIYADHLSTLERDTNPAARAIVHRSLGLLSDDETFATHFSEALTQQRAAGQRFELARTQLLYGERLRRTGARRDARVQLHAARTGFESIDAAPWAERASKELRASGERLRGRVDRSSEELTPQELQIALAVAEGISNREVAAALFLSPKTVEWHLTRVYRKLGLRSRAELVRRFSDDARRR